MRAEQYVYFAIASDRTSAAQMAARIGLQPDSALVRGSKHSEPPVPRTHSWQIDSSRRDQPIGEQIEEVLGRIAPVADAIADLLTELEGGAHPRLEIVRVLNHSDQPETEGELLGWSISREHVQLLARLGAFVDVDEYDCASPNEDD